MSVYVVKGVGGVREEVECRGGPPCSPPLYGRSRVRTFSHGRLFFSHSTLSLENNAFPRQTPVGGGRAALCLDILETVLRLRPEDGLRCVGRLRREGTGICAERRLVFGDPRKERLGDARYNDVMKCSVFVR